MFDELIGRRVVAIYREGEDERNFIGTLVSVDNGFVCIRGFKLVYINISDLIKLKEASDGYN